MFTSDIFGKTESAKICQLFCSMQYSGFIDNEKIVYCILRMMHLYFLSLWSLSFYHYARFWCISINEYISGYVTVSYMGKNHMFSCLICLISFESMNERMNGWMQWYDMVWHAVIWYDVCSCDFVWNVRDAHAHGDLAVFVSFVMFGTFVRMFVSDFRGVDISSGSDFFFMWW